LATCFAHAAVLPFRLYENIFSRYPPDYSVVPRCFEAVRIMLAMPPNLTVNRARRHRA
jgi:hypothetical protein